MASGRGDAFSNSKSANAIIEAVANDPGLKTDEAIEQVIKAHGLKLLSEVRATAKRLSLVKIEAELRTLISPTARRLKELSGNDPFLVVQDMPTGVESNAPVIDQARDLVRRFGRLEVKTK